MDFVGIQSRIDALEQCSICTEKNGTPVQIKLCEHYSRIAIESNRLLKKLYSYCIDNIQVTVKDHVQNSIIEYNDRTYQIVYFSEKPVKVNAKGESPLHIACKKQLIDKVNDYLENITFDLNWVDHAGWSALHDAVDGRNIDIVSKLLQSGVLVNVPGPNYETPLHEAVQKGNIALVRALLEFGADANALNYTGMTPVLYTKRTQIIEALHENQYINLNPYKLFISNYLVAYCHSIDEVYTTKLMKCGSVVVKTNFNLKNNTDITHFIIKKSHKLSLKILLALVAGLIFAPQEWIDNYLAGDPFMDVPKYEFCQNSMLNTSIIKAVMNSLLKLPKLFSGINFYVMDHLKSITCLDVSVDKTFLELLIRTGGGTILKRQPTPCSVDEEKFFPYHANQNDLQSNCCNYVIFEEMNPPNLRYNMKELKHRTSLWLLQCVLKFEIHD